MEARFASKLAVSLAANFFEVTCSYASRVAFNRRIAWRASLTEYEVGDGCYAWPMRLSFLGNDDFELFVDAFRAAVSEHAASAVDAELLQLSIDRARQRVATGSEAAQGDR